MVFYMMVVLIQRKYIIVCMTGINSIEFDAASRAASKIVNDIMNGTFFNADGAWYCKIYLASMFFVLCLLMLVFIFALCVFVLSISVRGACVCVVLGVVDCTNGLVGDVFVCLLLPAFIWGFFVVLVLFLVFVCAYG